MIKHSIKYDEIHNRLIQTASTYITFIETTTNILVCERGRVAGGGIEAANVLFKNPTPDGI